MRPALLLIAALATSAHATPPEPRGAHPRMLLDDSVRAEWRRQATLAEGPVGASIRLCDDARTAKNHTRALYQGAVWAQVLQACLVAWAATDAQVHAKTALVYLTALLDDLDIVGDHRGGNASARRDSGYAIRNLGPYTAIAYDWLHDVMPASLKAKARTRWKAWLDWYRDHGYRARSPGSNYHAGWLLAATTIAIAQGGEAGSGGAALWREVADELWGDDMAKALSPGGVLAGGNWPEGWQYGPLSVAEYALGARVMKQAGVEVRGVAPWLASLVRHHIHAMSPAGLVYASGDTEDEVAHLRPSPLTYAAAVLGDTDSQTKRWAKGELARLGLVERDAPLYGALAALGGDGEVVPRASWPTSYVAENTGTLYARTRWDTDAVWFVAECHATIDTDHRHPNAGNFALSRGTTDVIVDPTPYGSQSTLTSNAPTIASTQLPDDYIPSQGTWGVDTKYAFVTQRPGGIVAARCTYGDQYRFQDRPSDVTEATRDFVFVSSIDGRDAALVIIDRAITAGGAMHLRFRTPGSLAADGESASATIDDTRLTIASVQRTSGTPSVRTPARRSCFEDGVVKGACDAARFPVTEYQVQIDGPRPSAVHVIAATGAGRVPVTATSVGGDGWTGVRLSGMRDAMIVWRTTGTGPLEYTSAASTMHVVLDGARLSSVAAGDQCRIEIAGQSEQPMVASVDAACLVERETEVASLPSSVARPGPDLRASAGCCRGQATTGSTLGMVVVVLVLSSRRRRPAK